MADYFVAIVAENVLSKLSSLAVREVSLAWGLETELEKIKVMFAAIKVVILDAEQQEGRNGGVKVWVEKLKEVLYDIEDVLDEFDYQALRKQAGQCMSTSRKVSRSFSSSSPPVFRFKMGHKLKKIRERVVVIAELKSKLGLKEKVNNQRHDRLMTHSFVDAARVIGRENNKEEIFTQLLNVVDGENVSVIPIVGIGGLGKTTLAKLVFNDQRVDDHFDMKLWVCISYDFDLQKVIIKILKSTGQIYQDMDLDRLQRALRDSLDGKKYLLVMDDVWNDDCRKWEELGSLLMGGAKGSKILVTTRSRGVASIMGTVPTYDLNHLPHGHCLSLFFKCAFKQGQDQQYPNLKRVGEDIVGKCKGVPLAVITLGTLLSSTTDEHDWEFVRDNEIWRLKQKENDIMPALRLSYEQLPSYLKRCFAYCSLFPKDYEYSSSELIPFWMAHGILQSSNEFGELEDVGKRYFNELCSRGFFHDVEEVIGSTASVRCKMHDLMHDLALLVAQNECSMITSSDQNVPKNVRHLSFSQPQSFRQEYFGSLDNLKQARTTFFFNVKNFDCMPIIRTCFARFQLVRAIDLSNCQFKSLPREIRCLKHLRYLNLESNYQILRLPNSICYLQNLQTLILFKCERLEELPRDIKCLISLRFLWLTIRSKCLPKDGIGCLKSLRTLCLDGCENLEYLMEDMQGLINLRNLCLTDCDKLISLPQSMKYLTSLERFVINHCDNLDLAMEEEENNIDSSQLQLKVLRIRKLKKLVELPQWLLPQSANTLHSLVLESCQNLRQLPMCLQNQTSIQQLEIGDCKLLSERCIPDTGNDWYKIAHVPKIVVNGHNLKN